MSILITGSAGFIGAALAKSLLDDGEAVIGVDNHNDYYDQNLKEKRLSIFKDHPHYKHHRIDIANAKQLDEVFKKSKPTYVINLAAQAGVRYSLTNPSAYIDSNLNGFANILEQCRNGEVKHLIYASSSSVYGSNILTPFTTEQNTDHPLSLYAATKKSNELMAHAYSHLFKIPCTGLRFFTVYGPWGRPDMALFKFTKSILNNLPIDLYNNGNHTRDFTYVNDIVAGIKLTIKSVPKNCLPPFKIYNLGSGNPIKLMEYIKELENSLNKKATFKLLAHQPGDLLDTYADTSDFFSDFNFKPMTTVKQGVGEFVSWYKNYHSIT